MGKLTYVSWRNKFTGWHDSWAMSIDGVQTAKALDWHDPYDILMKERKGFLNSRLSQGDMFYRLFLSDACLGKACYEKCKYKYEKSAADIRIGDLWGHTYAKEEKGVSSAIAFTEKGNDLLKKCNIKLIEHSFEIVAEGQLKGKILVTKYREEILQSLKNTQINIISLNGTLDKIMLKRSVRNLVKHPRSSLKSIIKFILRK